MEEANVEREIQELREQAELLAEKDASSDEFEGPVADGASADEEEDPSLLRAKLQELIGTIRKDLREIPATTAVAIFALGVLVGRLLPRRGPHDE